MLSCLHSHAVLLAALYCQGSDSDLCSVGTERSGSSFSSGITGRLTYADYGGAAWGAPTDAKLGTSFAPAVPSIQPPALTAFGPLGNRQAADGHGISQLWAPESPSTGPTMQSHKQIRHKREVSLSDLGYLGFVARDDHSGECSTECSTEYIKGTCWSQKMAWRKLAWALLHRLLHVFRCIAQKMGFFCMHSVNIG